MTKKIKVTDRLKGSISSYDYYCDGFGSPGASGNNYILGIVLGVGRSKIELTSSGSDNLDKINASKKDSASLIEKLKALQTGGLFYFSEK